jgi:hypothetical protein
MRVAVDQRRGAGLAQPAARQAPRSRSPTVSAHRAPEPGWRRAFAWPGPAARQRQLPGRPLPGGAAHLARESLVGDIVQALRVTVHQQYRRPKALQQVGSAQQPHAGRRRQARPRRKSRLPGMKTPGGCDHGNATRATQRHRRPAAGVVSDPDLEQIAQDEHGVRRASAPGVGARRRPVCAACRTQVQVGDEVDAPPLSGGASRPVTVGAVGARLSSRPIRWPFRSPRPRAARRHGSRLRPVRTPRWRRPPRCRPHPSEHGVAPALKVLGAEVEEVVVDGVDEELRGGGVRVAGAGHRQRVLGVLQAVVGLVAAMGARWASASCPGSKPPPWIMKPLITRWNTVPS